MAWGVKFFGSQFHISCFFGCSSEKDLENSAATDVQYEYTVSLAAIL